MIYIISGSIRPDVGKFRRGLRAVQLSCEEGEPVEVSQVDSQHRWLDGRPHELFSMFLSILKRSDGDDVILFADGGTGAARTTRYFSGDTLITRGGRLDHPMVMGFSDASVYPLMAWLWGYRNCYHGPNVVDFGAMDAEGLRDMYGLLTQATVPNSNVTFHSAEIVNGFGRPQPKTYKLVPVCPGTLRQTSRRVKQALVDRLQRDPSVLMFDDAYPNNAVGTLALYEDLTALTEVVEALAISDGILAVGSVPFASDVLYDYKAVFPDLQMVSGVDFGHLGDLNTIIPYGQKARVTYDPLSGLGVKME